VNPEDCQTEFCNSLKSPSLIFITRKKRQGEPLLVSPCTLIAASCGAL
jgi:hypothetical protein